MKNKKLLIGIFIFLFIIFITLNFLYLYFENIKILLGANIIYSILILIMGIAQKIFPPIFEKNKKIIFTKYNSKRARADNEHWEKAQQLFGIYTSKLGIIYLIFDLILILFIIYEKSNLFNTTEYLLIVFFKYVIWEILPKIYIENKLKKLRIINI